MSKPPPASRAKGAPKDPNAPKGALSAYMLFQRDARAALLAARPGLGFGAVGKELGLQWRALDDEEKARYESLAEADRARAKAEAAAYAPPGGAAAGGDAAEEAPKKKGGGGGGGFTQQLRLSPALIAFFGLAAGTTLSRPEARAHDAAGGMSVAAQR